MTPLDDILKLPPYRQARQEKQALLLEHLTQLCHHHREHCPPYARLLKAHGVNGGAFADLSELPYLPIRLFKEFSLKSVADSEVVKTLTSSGTTGSQVSKIFLDKETSRYQTRALAAIMQDFIGGHRLPMLIVDTASVIKDRNLFSARGAGILGMMNFGHDHLYVLNDDMSIKTDELKAFLSKWAGQPILLFGFTFMVWQYFVEAIEASGLKVDLSGSVLVHSGGWKKLTDRQVDNQTFKSRLQSLCGIQRVHNFYGMVEQVGSVYVECEAGRMHAPVFSEVIIRDHHDWSVCPKGKLGIIEVLSILPYSYPGHVLLTEDMGVVLGEDDCPCGRMGKHFQIVGRIPKAEMRGCSDTYEEQ